MLNADQKSRDAIAAYQEILSMPQFSTTVPCTQCGESLTSGVILAAPLRRFFRSADDRDLWCDRDCLENWCQEHVDDLAKWMEPAVLRGGWVEVLA